MFNRESEGFDPRPWLWLLALISVTMVLLRLLRRRRGLFDRIRPGRLQPSSHASVADFPPYPYRREAADSGWIPEPPLADKPVEIELPRTDFASEVAPMASAPQADDLKIIEGIGPVLAGVLNEAGITTFTQLSEASQERLREILGERRLRLTDPATWPEQAALAAKGDWDGLRALQANLRAGRRAG
jgi:predicted flap endonuclease-1-like 5' DNA nuclease